MRSEPSGPVASAVLLTPAAGGAGIRARTGFLNLLQRQPPALTFAAACVMVAVIGCVDRATGYEITLYPLYSLPILWVVYLGSRRAALATAALSAAVWWWADASAGHQYTSNWLQLWDAVVRLMVFWLVAAAGSAFKQQRDTAHARIALLERTQRLEREIIGASESERQRIGRDLHDGLCQYLAAIGFTADLLRQDLARERHGRAAAAGEIAQLLQDALARTREVARGLSPVDRDEEGLESALEELAGSTARLVGISCAFVCPEPVSFDDEIRAVHLFRIAQEAISNATRHGRAQHVVIALEAAEGELSLRVSDDGCGFELDPAARGAGGGCARQGMGLNIMRYRARAVGGVLEIYPNSPVGAVVACTLPHRRGGAATRPAAPTTVTAATAIPSHP